MGRKIRVTDGETTKVYEGLDQNFDGAETIVLVSSEGEIDVYAVDDDEPNDLDDYIKDHLFDAKVLGVFQKIA